MSALVMLKQRMESWKWLQSI